MVIFGLPHISCYQAVICQKEVGKIFPAILSIDHLCTLHANSKVRIPFY